MSSKSKGINAERDLIHKFWSVDWAAVRVAGSGSSRYPCCDIVAGNRLRKLAIECKTSKEKQRYLTKDEIDQLKVYASLFGAEPWVAVRFDRMDWHFLSLDDLHDAGNSFAISRTLAEQRGLLLEEVIK